MPAILKDGELLTLKRAGKGRHRTAVIAIWKAR